MYVCVCVCIYIYLANCVWFENCADQHSLNWAITMWKQPKTFVQRGKAQLTTVQSSGEISLVAWPPARSNKPKIMDSKAVQQAIEANPMSNIREYQANSLSYSPVSFHHFHNLSKTIQSYQIVPYIIKILLNFWLSRVNDCYIFVSIHLQKYKEHTISFQTFFVWAFKIGVNSWKFSMLLPSRSCWNGTISASQLEEITLKGTRVSCMYCQ